MTPAESYRLRAAEFRMVARFTENRQSAAEWTRLADAYTRLAEQAEANGKLDIAVEVGPPLRLDGGNGTSEAGA